MGVWKAVDTFTWCSAVQAAITTAAATPGRTGERFPTMSRLFIKGGARPGRLALLLVGGCGLDIGAGGFVDIFS